MDTRKVATEYRLAQWARMIRDRKENNESVLDFCQRVGVSKNAYYYWQRRLRQAACEQLITDAPQASIEEPVFAQVHLAERLQNPIDTRQCEASLKIDVGGCVIHVDNGTNPELLAQVCRLLKAL